MQQPSDLPETAGTDAGAAMRKAVQRTSAMVGDHALSVLCPVREVSVECREEALVQALVYLLSDAFTCTQPECSVFFTAEKVGDRVIFTLSDDGGSFTDGDAQGVFHIPNSELNLCRELIAECGGEVRAECNEQGGMTFTASVPVKDG